MANLPREHLYRNHQQPIRCRRCYMSFETDMDYDAHMRSTDRCENRPPPEQTDGFNAMQKNRLRSRPKGYKSMSEAQKWRHVYLILFPETRESDIPSPCKRISYNYPITDRVMTTDTCWQITSSGLRAMPGIP